MKNHKFALVTGSSSGFGLLTSIELAKNGFHVIATMRDLTKAGQLLNATKKLGVDSNIHLHCLDVTSDESINQLKTYLADKGHIDVLVNNAGYAGAGFVEEIPLSEYRQQFETNVFGAIAVTQAVLPLMRLRGMGKIINVSSISGKVGFPGLSPYNASKHALEGWSESLRLEMKPYGVDVVIIEPGSYDTSIWTSGKQVTEKSLSIKSPYYKTMTNIENYLSASANHYGDPSEVANLIVRLAKKEKTKLRYPIGKGVKLMVFLKNFLPWRIWETIILRQIR